MGFTWLQTLSRSISITISSVMYITLYNYVFKMYRDMVFLSSWYKKPDDCKYYLKLMYDNNIEITRDDLVHVTSIHISLETIVHNYTSSVNNQ